MHFLGMNVECAFVTFLEHEDDNEGTEIKRNFMIEISAEF